MDDNEQVLAESYRGFGTLLLAVLALSSALLVAWSLATGTFTMSDSEAPGLTVILSVVIVLVVWASFNVLAEKVVVKTSGLMVRRGLRWRFVPWSQVDEIGAVLFFWGRLMVTVRHQDSKGRWRWLGIGYLGFHSGYRNVLRALVLVAESEEYLGKIKVSGFILAEARAL